MSERTPRTPRDIRRHAISLMRRCWKTLLLAAVLMSMIDWLSEAAMSYGEYQGEQAARSYLDAFKAEYPAPDAQEWAEYQAYQDILLAQTLGDAEESDLPPKPENYDALVDYGIHLYFAAYNAQDAYDAALQPWKLANYGAYLIGALFSGVVAVGVYRGLLSSLRGGVCSPGCVLSGNGRTGTAMGVAAQTLLRVLGWCLLALIPGFVLTYWFGDTGEVIGRILFCLVCLWAQYHYSLAPCHLADEREPSLTAADCLRLAVDDIDAFTIRKLAVLLWPVIGIFLAQCVLAVIAALVPVLDIPLAVLTALLALFSQMLELCCLICLYEEMRQREAAAKAALPPDMGADRARALAAAGLDTDDE